MTKAAHLLTSLIFALICAGLWGLWWLGEQYLAASVGGGSLTLTMQYALKLYPWLFGILPFPAIIYSAFHMDRVDILPEKSLLYFVIMTFVSMILLGATVVLFALELRPFA